jgi:hypothetical protein
MSFAQTGFPGNGQIRIPAGAASVFALATRIPPLCRGVREGRRYPAWVMAMLLGPPAGGGEAQRKHISDCRLATDRVGCPVYKCSTRMRNWSIRTRANSVG